MNIDIYGAAPMVLGARRVLQPGRWRWLRAIAWMVGLVFLIALSFGPGMEAIRHLVPKGDPRFGFLTNVSGAVIALAAYALLVRLGEDRLPEELAPRPAAAQLLAGMAIGATMFVAVMAIMAIFGLYQITWHGPAAAWRAGGLAIQAGVIEEILVRGVILRLLWRAFGPLAAFSISAAIFGVGHLFNPGATWVAALCIALEAGIMLGAFYALTGRLWASIGVHAAWNFSQGYLFGAAVSGGNLGPAVAHSVARPGPATWLTGGAFGPEASLPALAVCSTVGLATLWLAWKAGRFANEANPLRGGAPTMTWASMPRPTLTRTW
jgi:membrane protease YdiL (CAAX protease family)